MGREEPFRCRNNKSETVETVKWAGRARPGLAQTPAGEGQGPPTGCRHPAHKPGLHGFCSGAHCQPRPSVGLSFLSSQTEVGGDRHRGRGQAQGEGATLRVNIWCQSAPTATWAGWGPPSWSLPPLGLIYLSINRKCSPFPSLGPGEKRECRETAGERQLEAMGVLGPKQGRVGKRARDKGSNPWPSYD